MLPYFHRSARAPTALGVVLWAALLAALVVGAPLVAATWAHVCVAARPPTVAYCDNGHGTFSPCRDAEHFGAP